MIESGVDVYCHWQSGSYCPTRELRRLLSRAVASAAASRSDSGCAHFQRRSLRAQEKYAHAGEVYMALIYIAEFHHENPFEYVAVVDISRHARSRLARSRVTTA